MEHLLMSGCGEGCETWLMFLAPSRSGNVDERIYSLMKVSRVWNLVVNGFNTRPSLQLHSNVPHP